MVGSSQPIPALNSDIRTSEPNAPKKTIRRGCRIARMAAMRNVLSPISEAMIMKKECRTAWKGDSVMGEDILDDVGVCLCLVMLGF